MCGIAGFVRLSPEAPGDLEAYATRMGAVIAHRGPDDAGVWVQHELGVALSHQRLAILDLSSAGLQPMTSASGRYVIAFNGEIYNHLDIRSQLESARLSPRWRGHSDTETLLAAIEAWGLEVALQRCMGMWALALVDRRDHQLLLARDRFGEKPLYWGLTGRGQGQALLFGSELSALRAYPGFQNPINRHALTELLRFCYVPAPLSIYSGISKLPAGHFVSIPLPLQPSTALPDSHPWWQLTSQIETCYAHPFISEDAALGALEQALIKAVADQALADVPLGAFLSGGIDSSLVTTLLQIQSNRPVRTFTIAFEDAAFNEAPHARAVAAHLGTEHVETMLTSADARALIPQLPQLYSEPFADSSQLPTHLVCREARRAGLTVALCGDGGDELFGGYNRYFWGPRIWNRLAWLPSPFRHCLGRAITNLPPQAWDVLGRPLSIQQLGHKAYKLGSRLRHVNSSDDLYRSLICESSDHEVPLQSLPACLSNDPIARMMCWDALGYLPDDILVKVDRAAMAVGLETRAPFLDHRVADVAWRIPMSMKIRGGNNSTASKWALRQILYKHVPQALIERPKAGFAIPIGQWLRGPLRSWAADLIHPDRLRSEGYLSPEPISQLWQQHLSGRYDHTTRLWSVMMWQAWREQWG